jgi:cytochrome c biogenesis protein CcmG/thiol:disulfide interchange protein DsbE
LRWDIIELLFFAYRDFVGDADQELEAFGFGRAHHRVMHFVTRYPGLKVADLLDVLRITKQSLGRVLKQLLDEGYILQKTGSNDRRQRLLYATAKGEALGGKLAGLQADATQVPGLDPAAFKGKVSLVNVWASWCVPCHDEAPLLTEVAKDKRFQLVGINYKDASDNARRFLGRYGTPFGRVGVDANGRASIEWGVYGVPETFVVGREGTIVYKLVGPITPDNLRTVLMPQMEKALKAGS